VSWSAVVLVECVAPLHAGAGEGCGAIDRPLVRDAASGLPFVPASSVKGACRDAARWAAGNDGDSDKFVAAAFGRTGTEEHEDTRSAGAGCVLFTDLELMALPVRSAAGGYAWVTAPGRIARLLRACDLAGLRRDGDLAGSARGVLEAGGAGLKGDQAVGVAEPETGQEGQGCEPLRDTVRWAAGGQARYVLGELVLHEGGHLALRQALGRFARALAEVLWPGTGGAFWRQALGGRLVLVPDEVLGRLAARCTQVEAAIALDPGTGTTRQGSLRYTEYLPSETLLAGLVRVEPPRGTSGGIDLCAVKERIGTVIQGVVRLGADETRGRGMVRVVLHPSPERRRP